MDIVESNSLPLPTIRRYPIYLRTINKLMAEGELFISSYALAERLGLDTVLTRKDLAMAGVPGRPRRGYPAKELSEAINRALGWDSATDAALIGVGSLGSALLGYSGFEEQNLSVAVAFDADKRLQMTSIHGVKVHPMEDLKRLVRQLKIKLAILAVPNAAAQDCADELVDAKIKGILNFTAVQLSVPKGVIVQNVDLAQPLAVLSHAIARNA
ncbi:MAG: redox-sensing transcriptional repressor Rex [Verrucomicrobiota bacterium]|nr:redox-sensing transcriptional repressor Rex [Verrucomicrobiota bacterium]MDY5597566.1 redox-sensing transcriptional repressor Rex [Kiritimatiellia bacterium]